MHSTLISAAATARALQRADAPPVLLDCGFDLADPAAGERAWRQGHLPGAHYLHLDARPVGPEDDAQALQRPPSAARARDASPPRLGALGIDAGDAGGRLRRAGRRLCGARLVAAALDGARRDVAVLDGGLAAWQRRRRRARRPTRRAPHADAALPGARAADADDRRRHAAAPASAACAWSTRAPASASAARSSRWTRRPATFPARATASSRTTSRADGRFKTRRRSCAPSGSRCSAGRRRRGGALVRLGRDRLPQPAGDGPCRARRPAAVPRLVERVVAPTRRGPQAGVLRRRRLTRASGAYARDARRTDRRTSTGGGPCSSASSFRPTVPTSPPRPSSTAHRSWPSRWRADLHDQREGALPVQRDLRDAADAAAGVLRRAGAHRRGARQGGGRRRARPPAWPARRTPSRRCTPGRRSSTTPSAAMRPDRDGLARPPRRAALLLGSETQQVLTHSKMPVLVVK